MVNGKSKCKRDAPSISKKKWGVPKLVSIFQPTERDSKGGAKPGEVTVAAVPCGSMVHIHINLARSSIIPRKRRTINKQEKMGGIRVS